MRWNKKQMMVLVTTRQRAEAGDAEAMLRLARLYEKGEIVDQDAAEAQRWRERARAASASSAKT